MAIVRLEHALSNRPPVKPDDVPLWVQRELLPAIREMRALISNTWFDATIDVRKFGAVANDPAKASTNDTAFANAIAYVIAQGSGTIYVPAGTWYISHKITVSGAHCVNWRGEPAKSGDSTTNPLPGSAIKPVSTWTGARRALDVLGTVACTYDMLNVDGKDENGLGQLCRGISISAGNVAIGPDHLIRRCQFVDILNPCTLTGQHADSNLTVDNTQMPQVDVIGLPGKTDLWLLKIVVNTVGTGQVGSTTVDIYIDGGKSPAATNVTTGSSVAVPGTTLHLNFRQYYLDVNGNQQAATYTAKQVWYSEGCGIYLGDRFGTQVDHLRVEDCGFKDCNDCIMTEGGQTIGVQVIKCRLDHLRYGMFVCGGWVSVDDYTIENDSRALAMFHIRCPADTVNISNGYGEDFGGDFIEAVPCTRTSSINVQNARLHFRDQTVGGYTNKPIRYQQAGTLHISGLEVIMADPGHSTSMFYSAAPGQQSYVDESGSYLGAGVSKDVSGTSYFGPANGLGNSNVSAFMMHFGNRGAEFTGIPGFDALDNTNRPANMIGVDGTGRTVLTSSDRHIQLRIGTGGIEILNGLTVDGDVAQLAFPHGQNVLVAGTGTGSGAKILTWGVGISQKLELGDTSAGYPGLQCLAGDNTVRVICNTVEALKIAQTRIDAEQDFYVKTVRVQRLTTTASLNYGAMAANTTQDIDVTVTGALVGDNCVATPEADIGANAVWSCYIKAADKVTVRVGALAALTVTTQTWRVDVWRT